MEKWRRKGKAIKIWWDKASCQWQRVVSITKTHVAIVSSRSMVFAVLHSRVSFFCRSVGMWRYRANGTRKRKREKKAKKKITGRRKRVRSHTCWPHDTFRSSPWDLLFLFFSLTLALPILPRLHISLPNLIWSVFVSYSHRIRSLSRSISLQKLAQPNILQQSLFSSFLIHFPSVLSQNRRLSHKDGCVWVSRNNLDFDLSRIDLLAASGKLLMKLPWFDQIASTSSTLPLRS